LIKPRLFVKITNNFNTNTEVKGVITFNKISYTEVFKFDPLTNNLSANFNIENFSDKTFDITLFYLDTSSTITLNSIKPTNALSVNDALNFLQKNQPTLIDGYFDENKNFNAELFVRLIVEKEKPYYYIGIATSKKVVAFLLDGYTGEVLSIKEVF